MRRRRDPARARRVAVLSLHTSPLELPGTGDAGGMNVYIAQTATRMAERGTEVEVFTRATSADLPPTAELAPGVTVRHIAAGPYQGLAKNDLPGHLCAFHAGVLRTEASHSPGYYDVVASHYWLSGQVGWLARDRWGVPLVHTAHTLAKVKHRTLAEGESPEPPVRVAGEERVVAEADKLVVNTEAEAADLAELYGARPEQLTVVPPGVDLERFTPDGRAQARTELGLAPEAVVLAFVGRIQPLKAPDVLLHAAAEMVRRDPGLRARLVVLIVGGPSGTGLERPAELHELAGRLGITELVRFLPPRPGAALATVYRAADVVAVPSHSESFGLVALEAQACGTPVAAAAVGGLPVAVADGVSGILVPDRRAGSWADALGYLALEPARWREFATAASAHASAFSWDRTTERLLAVYDQAAAELRTTLEIAV
ncbi:D-inositol-3-phosphate glycosyltransferase [Crossiella sp. NPDC003009]